MYPGIFSRTFSTANVSECFWQVKAHGFRGVQFNFISTGLPSLPDQIPDAVIDEVVLAGKEHQISVDAISATFNLTHPNENIIESGLVSLEAMAGAAKKIGCNLLTLCTGTLNPDNMWRRHPNNNTPAAWKALLRSMEKAILIAGRHDVYLGIEPEMDNIVNSAQKARDLIDEFRGGRIKVVFDPANLFEKTTLSEQHRIIDEAFDLLGDDIAVAHAKDRHPDGSFAVAGKGVLDYRHFLAGLKKAGFNGSVIAHGLEAEDAGDVSEMLSEIIDSL